MCVANLNQEQTAMVLYFWHARNKFFQLYFYYSIYLGLTSFYSLISAKVITGNSTSFSRFSLKSPLTASKQYNH